MQDLIDAVNEAYEAGLTEETSSGLRAWGKVGSQCRPGMIAALARRIRSQIATKDRDDAERLAADEA